MRYRFTLETKSMLLTGSGEGGVLIDADVIFHPNGFPYIPAKRIKGMLKESMEEVLEIFGKTEQEIRETLITFFGNQGQATYAGKLTFSNLFVENWNEIKNAVQADLDNPAFSPDFIKAYFTSEVKQTAIDDDGTAKPRSLRNYRVINPNLIFESEFNLNNDLTPDELHLLQHAVSNLRYAGTRRNKGFGKVKCQIEATPQSVQAATANGEKSSQGEIDSVSVHITTLTPVVLAEQLGDQNTVFTSRQITGNQLRGLLANLYIRKHLSGARDAHLDPTFFEVFLSGKIQFGALTFKNSRPIPLHIHGFKKDKSRPPVSVFTKPEGITKPVNKQGFVNNGAIEAGEYTPASTFNFHNSRENRAAGRNTENDTTGGIFYYESLNEGQIFTGEITGDSTVLAKLSQLFTSQFNARLGRSKSVQYGEVQVAFEPKTQGNTNKSTTYPAGKYVLVLESPLVLLNDHGLPEPSAQTLLAELPSGVRINNAASAITMLEQFNSIWQSKSGKYTAFKEGSSFLLEFPTDLTLKAPISFLGEWNSQGFGKVHLEPFDSTTQYHFSESTDNKSASSDTPASNPPIIVAIKKAFEDQKQLIEIKTKAIEDADKSKKILNHQIGRLERLFETSESEAKIAEWIAQTKEKPAGEALKALGLINDDHKLRLKRHSIENFEVLKIYWITFFQTLRKKNKSND